MKSGTVKFKVEGRQSVHRRRLSKSGFNGGDLSADDESIARQVNLAAAYRDQVSCCSQPTALTKAPCKTDHLYANCSEDKNLVVERGKMQLRKMVVSHHWPHFHMIGQFQEELAHKTRQVYPLFDEKLAARVRRDRRMCLLRCQERAPPVLATRYFGRKSKTIPSRALKRRYMGPPKSFPSRPLPLSPKEEGPTSSAPPPLHVKEEAEEPAKRKRSNADHLTTPREYFLPEAPVADTPTAPPHIDVPLWKVKPVTSFYQMEGTENINDPVFERRHQKYELDERRRKRWDLQRLREQRAKNERMRKKREREDGNLASFFPDPQHVEFIEVTDQLPVLAFGHPIPLFQPCDFSLPWIPEKNSAGKGRRGRPPSTSNVT